MYITRYVCCCTFVDVIEKFACEHHPKLVMLAKGNALVILAILVA